MHEQEVDWETLSQHIPVHIFAELHSVVGSVDRQHDSIRETQRLQSQELGHSDLNGCTVRSRPLQQVRIVHDAKIRGQRIAPATAPSRKQSGNGTPDRTALT